MESTSIGATYGGRPTLGRPPLARLPDVQRQTFVLHVEGELTYREVAESLGISIGTVMSRIFYARKKLRAYLALRIRL